MAAGETLANVAALFAEFAARLVAADVLEIVLDASGGELEVLGEEWTLHLEGWPGRPLAWLALDDEPDDPAELTVALNAALDEESIAAFVAVDAALGRTLSAALRASHDPLSTALADRTSAIGA